MRTIVIISIAIETNKAGSHLHDNYKVLILRFVFFIFFYYFLFFIFFSKEVKVTKFEKLDNVTVCFYEGILITDDAHGLQVLISLVEEVRQSARLLQSIIRCSKETMQDMDILRNLPASGLSFCIIAPGAMLTFVRTSFSDVPQ